MQTNRSEYYLRKGFGFIDLGLNGLLDRCMRDVYEVLRRFVWRTDESGHPEMRAMYREGFLVARIAQSSLGTLVQVSRQQVNAHIAALRRLGWIKVVSFVDKNVGTKAYVLGETVHDTSGRRHEVFYADGMLRDLWDTIDAKAKIKQGPQATPLTAFTNEERIELVREVLNAIQGPSTEDDTPCQVNPTPPGGYPVYPTPPVKSTGHPLSSSHDTPCQPGLTLEEEKGEPSQKTQFQKAEAPPSAGDPFAEPEPYSVSDTKSYGVSTPVTVGPGLSTAQLMVASREEALRRREELMNNANAKESKLANLKGRTAPVMQRAAIDKIEKLWRSLYAESYPDQKIAAWERNGKERKSIEAMINKYDAETTELALNYAIREWVKLRERRFKGVAYPSLGLILSAHETVFAEAQQFARAMRIVREAKAVWETGGLGASLSETQQAQYEQAVKDLKVMGYEV